MTFFKCMVAMVFCDIYKYLSLIGQTESCKENWLSVPYAFPHFTNGGVAGDETRTSTNCTLLSTLVIRVIINGNNVILFICTVPTLLSLHTIIVHPLTTVYIVSEVHCTSNIL